MRTKFNSSFIYVALAASLWGIAGIFVRALQKSQIAQMEIVFGRVFFTALILGVIILFKGAQLFKIKLKDIWLFACSGVGSIVLFNFSYYTTMSLTSLSVAAVLLYTAPFFVMIISVFLFKKRLTLRKCGALFIAFLGCALVSGVFEVSLRISPKALIFGLLTGFGYALYTIFGELLINRGYKTLTITFYVFAFATVGTLPFINLGGLFGNITPYSAVWVFLMAVFNTVLPYIFYTRGLFGVDPTVAPIIATVEPVVATLVGVFVFAEPISAFGILGILLVLSSVVLLNVKSKSLVKIRANAKINLYLYITGKREDGYHLLDTVMQSVSLCDEVIIKKSKEISLKCSQKHLSGEGNLGTLAARLFFEAAQINEGVKIYIKKAIPEAAGLGGGSADAAAVLLGLNRLYGEVLSFEKLSEIALRLGADVPFFLMGGTVRATGIGEKLEKLTSLNKGYIVVAKQGEKPSTGEMYRRIDSNPYKDFDTKPFTNALEKGDLTSLCGRLYNDFSVAWEGNPLLERLKSFSPLGAGVSGSGPSCFGIFDVEKQARKCVKSLKKQGITAFAVTPEENALIICE